MTIIVIIILPIIRINMTTVTIIVIIMKIIITRWAIGRMRLLSSSSAGKLFGGNHHISKGLLEGTLLYVRNEIVLKPPNHNVDSGRRPLTLCRHNLIQAQRTLGFQGPSRCNFFVRFPLYIYALCRRTVMRDRRTGLSYQVIHINNPIYIYTPPS